MKNLIFEFVGVKKMGTNWRAKSCSSVHHNLLLKIWLQQNIFTLVAASRGWRVSEVNSSFRKAEFSLPDDENGGGSRNVGLLYNWLEWSLQARMEVVWLQWEVYSGLHPHQRELGVVELWRSEKSDKQAFVLAVGRKLRKRGSNKEQWKLWTPTVHCVSKDKIAT
jgi:hypothetical protein